MEEKFDVSKVHKTLGGYRFRIEGYSGLSDKVGDSVESPEFQICGHTWQLRLFPGGSLDAHKGFISYYLASKSTTLARASYKLMILNQTENGADETFSSSGIRIFEPKGIQVDGWGRDKFMLANALENPEMGFLVDDAVNFRVEITVFGDLETSPLPTPPVANTTLHHSRALDVCLQKILQDSIGCDATLVVSSASGDGTESESWSEQLERIPVHKALLMARSPVFCAMFSCDMIESASSEVAIPDVDPAVLREMLHFMYTDRCSSPEVLSEMGIPLLCVALKYQVCRLVDACEEYFAGQLAEDTAVFLLSLADTHGAVALKHKALLFISQHSPGQLTATEEYQELSEELQREASVVIEAATKRHGLRGGFGSEKREGRRLMSTYTCTIM